MDRFLVISSIMLSFCCLLASAQQGPFDILAGPGSNVSRSLTLGTSEQQIVAMVQGNRSILFLNVKYSVGDPGPVCFLEIWKTTNISRWTKPCPRTPQLLPPVGFWCLFEFSLDGNLVLASGPNDQNKAENPTVLWSSNTTGSGATSLGLLNSDTEGRGNMVLYNANKEIVWGNIATSAVSEDYSCTGINQTPIGAPLSAANDEAPTPSPNSVAVPDQIAPAPFVGVPDDAPAPSPSPQAGRKLLVQH